MLGAGSGYIGGMILKGFFTSPSRVIGGFSDG